MSLTWKETARLRPLCRLAHAGWRQNLGKLLTLTIVGVALATVGVSWDEAHGMISLGGVELKDMGHSQRALAFRLLLAELFSVGWVVGCFVYLVPTVLFPLASSFSLSQTLWLRLTPARGWELALARLARLLSATAVLAGLATAWLGICALRHQLPLAPLLVSVLGVAAHTLASGALVLVFAPNCRTTASRAVLVLAAVLSPILLFIVFLQVRGRLRPSWTAYWPYACPFAQEHFASGTHYLALLGVALLLLVVSLFLQPGRVVGVSQVPKEVRQ